MLYLRTSYPRSITVHVTGLLPACSRSLQNALFGSGAAMEVPSLY